MNRIAIYHNLPSGGGKRALYEITKRLKNDYKIDLYILNTANERFCSLFDFVDHVFTYKLFKITNSRQPWSFLMFITKIIDLFFLARISKKIARIIDAKQYEFVFITNCYFTHHPYILKYLKTKTVLYSQEPPRMIYEKNYQKIESSGRNKIISFIALLLLIPYHLILKIIDKINVKSANLVLVNSKFSQEIFKRCYNIKTTVLYLGVDTAQFNYQNIIKESVILSVGAINPLKGQLLILDAISLIPYQIRPEFVIVGDRGYPGEDERLKKIAKQKNVKLAIMSNVDNKELIKQYNRAKITACAAYFEPFGFTAIESLACQTPIVAINEGGYCETIINNKTGFLVKRDAQEFSNALIKLLKNDALRKNFGQEGRKFVIENFAWDKTFNNFKKCIKLSE